MVDNVDSHPASDLAGIVAAHAIGNQHQKTFIAFFLIAAPGEKTDVFVVRPGIANITYYHGPDCRGIKFFEISFKFHKYEFGTVSFAGMKPWGS
jgi:hypothetical protein